MVAQDAEAIHLSFSKWRPAALTGALLTPKSRGKASTILQQSVGKVKSVGGATAAIATGELSAIDATHLQKYRMLTRQHLDRRTFRLFHELTGLPLHVAWVPTLPQRWTVETLPSGSFLCLQTKKGRALPGCGGHCAARHLALALKAGPAGHRFTCHRGISNIWLPIRVLGLTVGLASVQALDGLSSFGPRCDGTSSAVTGTDRLQAAERSSGHKARRLHRQQFDRSARLLRLLVRYAEGASLASLREADLAVLRQVVVQHESEAGRLRGELRSVLPFMAKKPAVPQTATHSEQVVRWMLNCIQEHSPKPVTMQFCADRLGLHPSYLSTLFSRKVGVPFRTYMRELRVEKARQLLGDPVNRIAEVATAVGYADENSFRLAFKKATGLAPAAWRDAIRTPLS